MWDKDRDLKRTHSMPPEDAATGGTWAAVSSGPDSADPTLERQFTSSSSGRAAVNQLVASGQCPDENLLVDLAEGKIQGKDRQAIDRHLDTCAECSRLVIELAKLATPPRTAPKRYQVIRQLGAGAMGVVWEAEDSHLHRKVALKFVKPEGVDDKALRKRLLREARALAQVRHPNVMAVYDAGEADDEICLVLELITGSTARVWRAQKRPTTQEIVAAWRQAAAGLSAVHKAGIVHRDIKPDNVFVSDDGRVLIGDFGLARGGDLVDTTTTSLTVSGAVIGTPLYMSPEQLHGATATKKSDQFALAASIWEAVLDERPFRGTTIAAIVLAMQKVPEIPKTATPEQRRVLAILQKSLDPDPAKRFDDVDGLIAALAQPAKSSNRAIWIGVGAVVAAVGATVAVLAATRQQAATPVIDPKPELKPEPKPEPKPEQKAVEQKLEPKPVEVKAEGKGTLPVKDEKGQARRVDKPIVKPVIGGGSATIASAGSDAASTEDTSYTHLMMRASDKLNFGDGAGCLKLLANIPDLPDDELRRVELVKANCRMATGDCVGGAAAIEATGKKLGWDASQIKTTLESADKVYCPIDAPPQTRWAERAQFRLQMASGLGRSCKVVLDIIAKHNIVLPDQKSVWFLETQCMVNAGDCAGAKTRYLAQMLPQNADQKTRVETESAFHSTFKKCPP